MVGKALIYENNLIFGAWDKNLYALNIKNGTLKWKWDDGTANRMFSPTMATPVVYNNLLESQKIKTLVYGKTMNDEIMAFRTGKEKAEIAWRKDFGFRYNHVPSMLIKKGKCCLFWNKERGNLQHQSEKIRNITGPTKLIHPW